ncbi:MAG: CdaR family protein, partial [Chloroflexi bacterium]|nr:CdaR family protein [Chloroflexota bacterium]
MNARRTMRRLGRTIVHNWPLKLGAVVLATILYAGLVASQDSDTYVGPITVTPVNQPAGTVITNQLRDVGEVRYIAPADLGRLQAEDFRAIVDLANISPDVKPVAVPVQLTAIDPRVTILDVQPKSINVVLDELVSKAVDVTVVQAATPAGVEVGKVTVTPATVQVSGSSAAVNRVVAARVSASIDASALDVDRDIAPEA